MRNWDYVGTNPTLPFGADPHDRPPGTVLRDNSLTSFLKDPLIRPYFNDLPFDENNRLYPNVRFSADNSLPPKYGRNEIANFFETQPYNPKPK
jgi:hypothetical protein